MNILRKITVSVLLSLLFLPVMAQQKADTTYTFRFMAEKDMFYVPWNGNDTELARLLECIESNKTDILDGKLPLLVDGYCNSLGSETENLATAKIRANREPCHGKDPCQPCEIRTDYTCGNKRGEFHYPQPCD